MEATLKSKNSTEIYEIKERCKMFEEKYLEAINEKVQNKQKETNDESESRLKIKLKKELDQKRDENKAITLKYVKLKAEMKSLTTNFKKNQSLLKLREQEIALYQDTEAASTSTNNIEADNPNPIIKKEY